MVETPHRQPATDLALNIPTIDRARADAAPPASRFDRRKEDILNAAAVVINRHGLRDTTLAVVASEIGLNLKSLRYYFERREDLVAAAFLRSIAVHRELVDAALLAPNPAARVRSFICGYFAFRARVYERELPEVVHFGDLRAMTEPHSLVIGTAYVAFFRAVRALLVGPGQDWPRAELNAMAHLLISQLFWSVIWIDTYAVEDFARVADRFSGILLDGMALSSFDLSDAADRAPASLKLERLSQESFLRAATELINDYGYRGASVERISAMLNVTKGAFYHHNDTRDSLVLACFERTFEVVRDAQAGAAATAHDGASRVAQAMVTLVTRQMSTAGTMLRTSALTAVGPDLRDDMTRRMWLLTARFGDMLNDGMVDGSVRVCDVRIAAEMVTATVNSAAELKQWAPGIDADTVVDLYVRPFLRGLRAKQV